MIGFLLYETFEIAYYLGKGTFHTIYNISSWLFNKHNNKQIEYEDNTEEEIKDIDTMFENSEIEQLDYHLDVCDTKNNQDLYDTILKLQQKLETLENELKREKNQN